MTMTTMTTRALRGHVPTPIGTLHLTWTSTDRGTALCGARFDDERPPIESLLSRHGIDVAERESPVPEEIAYAFQRYFDGELGALAALPTLDVGTPFQRDVWQALREIPVGETRSYGDIARAVGRPKSVRAVGAANGANPIAVVVPCHRVIGTDGTLVGYGGGLDRKRWLLAHEALGDGVA